MHCTGDWAADHDKEAFAQGEVPVIQVEYSYHDQDLKTDIAKCFLNSNKHSW